ncbi:hypothetical protein A2Z33_05705 [Candidatus Gottesmanbacteria bacterium RBG_16_52_11]|uniref:ABC transporter domain-containing protein n=1 Tax=Candidatus Gottesmanbacteria bacterium RBG_16_52_11 TaxID=1798374 RepID=A0A1F5YX50_9BACT|nr:MAG: hypothetical protein A2Z33_05705 [Candidatus Gottesmanbacteria bacterium RBG_16_52_11]
MAGMEKAMPKPEAGLPGVPKPADRPDVTGVPQNGGERPVEPAEGSPMQQLVSRAANSPAGDSGPITVALPETGAAIPINPEAVPPEKKSALEESKNFIRDYLTTGDLILRRYAPENRKRIIALGTIISLSDAGLASLSHFRRKLLHDKNIAAHLLKGAKDAMSMNALSDDEIDTFLDHAEENPLWKKLGEKQQTGFERYVRKTFALQTQVKDGGSQSNDSSDTTEPPPDDATKKLYAKLARETLRSIPSNRLPPTLKKNATGKLLDAAAIVYSKKPTMDTVYDRLGKWILRDANWDLSKDVPTEKPLQIRATELLERIRKLDPTDLKASARKIVLVDVLYPVYIDAAELLLQKIKIRALTSMETELLEVKHHLNERIATSLLLRDFEYTGGQSPVDFLQKVYRSRNSVTGLVKSYADILPTVISFGGNFVPRFSGGSWVTPAMTAARLSAAYYLRDRPSHQPQIRRKLPLKFWEPRDEDLVMSRIVDGLELIKTSPSVSDRTRELTEVMDKSDRRQNEWENEIWNRPKYKPYNPIKRIRQDVGKYVQRLQDEGYVSELITQGAGVLHALTEYRKPIGDALFHTPSFMVKDRIRRTYGRAETVDQAKENIIAGQKALGSAYLRYQAGISGLRSTEADLYKLQNRFKNIRQQLQSFHELEELLGPYDPADAPDGPKEKARLSVNDLSDHSIRVRNLTFKNILRDVSMDIPQGSIVVIEGPSGAGKTTLIRHMLGLYTAVPGTVSYGGVDLGDIKRYSEDSIYSIIGYAHQEPRIFPELTLRENLTLWTPNHIEDDQLKEILSDLLLDKFTGRLDEKIKNLSGGERRRLSIARAIIRNPKILFLDEPLSNLDRDSQKQVMEIVGRLHRQNPDMTIIGVTHEEMFEAVADQVIDVRKVNGPPQVKTVYVGTGKPDTRQAAS